MRVVPSGADDSLIVMSLLEFTLYGKPVPKGSVVAFVPRTKGGGWARRPDGSPLVVKHDDNAGNEYASNLTAASLRAMGDQAFVQVDAAGVELSVVFSVPRPKSHYGSGRNEDVLKASAPARPATRPDVDKWLRQVLDALKGAVYRDDGQVVTVVASKVFVERWEQYRTDIVVSVLQERVMVTAPVEQLALVA